MFGIGKQHKNEIGLAGQDAHVVAVEFGRQPVAPMGVVLTKLGGECGVTGGSGTGQLGGEIDVEGATDAIDDVHDMGRADHPADAGSGKAHLAEGAHHDDVCRLVHQVEAGGKVGCRDVFGIGIVDHKQNVGPKTRVQATHFALGEIGAGGVVGIGQPDDFGARRDRLEELVDIGGVVGLVGQNDAGAGRLGDDGIDRKTVAVHHRLVAFAKIALGKQVQQIVRAVAANDAVGVDAMHFAQGGAQHAGAAFGIEFEIAGGRAEGLDGLGTGAKRGLVGGQLDRIAAGCAGLAG